MVLHRRNYTRTKFGMIGQLGGGQRTRWTERSDRRRERFWLIVSFIGAKMRQQTRSSKDPVIDRKFGVDNSIIPLRLITRRTSLIVKIGFMRKCSNNSLNTTTSNVEIRKWKDLAFDIAFDDTKRGLLKLPMPFVLAIHQRQSHQNHPSLRRALTTKDRSKFANCV